ncbi:hypothetical protein HY251_09040 [bacterium]|nr:hypothetical protein [bacterium]
MNRRLACTSALAWLLLAAGCPSANRLDDDEISRLPKVAAEGVWVRFDADVESAIAQRAAPPFVQVRDAVARELGLDPKDPPPIAEIVLRRDATWGQDRFLVTHAKVLEPPLRVQVPCPLSQEIADGEKVAALFRGTVAHEVAEATVLTRVRILDPYLRWMHDGIAESVEYRVLQRLDPPAAEKTIRRYRDYADEADKNAWRWVDLTRWRQLSEWIVHSDAFFQGGPLRVDDLKGSLERLADERVALELNPDAPEKPERLALFSEIQALLGENEVKKNLPLAPPSEGNTSPEVDPKLRGGAAQYLFYDASFCFWLELERAHPGATARVLAAIAARREPVLRSKDVVSLIQEATGEKVQVRLERFTLTRMRRILDAELPGK